MILENIALWLAARENYAQSHVKFLEVEIEIHFLYSQNIHIYIYVINIT